MDIPETFQRSPNYAKKNKKTRKKQKKKLVRIKLASKNKK